MSSTIYLIPTVLSEGQTDCLPSYILDAVKNCSVFFVEHERTARRFLKLLWKEMVIDDYEWINMKEVNDEVAAFFKQKIKEEKKYWHNQRSRVPWCCRSRATISCHCSANECCCETFGWTEFHFTCINGKWNERTAISICWLFAN